MMKAKREEAMLLIMHIKVQGRSRLNTERERREQHDKKKHGGHHTGMVMVVATVRAPSQR